MKALRAFITCMHVTAALRRITAITDLRSVKWQVFLAMKL